ncbi:portal protein [Methylorubrum rhodesianum]|uniref:Portal protein n=1 Tax=Methylorubrum rhodesianum TaxID=29427 RepID=A0ABU9ZDR3_9HYPH
MGRFTDSLLGRLRKPSKPESDAKGDALDKVLDVAKKRWRRADEFDRQNRKDAYEDLDFLETPGAQWPERERQLREAEGRPCLEFNRLPTTIAQITGDIRQMRPAIKVVPVDSRGDPETADVIAGMVRYVENRSDAASAYFSAADQQVGAGIGHWKVITEYGSDSTFEQEIRIVGIPDGVGVRWDPDAVLPTREDAKFCFVPVDMSRDVYEETYPDHPAAEIGDTDLTRSGMTEWAGADMVRIAEYYTKTPVEKTLALMPDGEILDLTDGGDEDHAEKLDLIAQAKATGAQVRIEKRPGHRVERYVISANAVLDGPTEIPGRFIPVVPVVGVEMTIGKRRARRGVIRFAKDSQRAYNYTRSTHTEVVALQPKAPFLGTEKMFKGYEEIWDTANSTNHPFLVYNSDPASPTARPERSQPPVASSGLAELSREAAEDMKAVTGVYDASLGARSNETSGKAIQARQREGDVGSFVYIVNFSRSIRHTGSIVVGMIPHVYDTARTLRIVGEDGKVDLVQINQVAGLADDGQPLDKVQNDVTVGAYDVAMEMGPSYTTRREAALDGMIQLVQAAPQLAPLVLDLLAKAQDWPMADKIAKRIRTMLPPQIQAQEAQESGEAPPPPMPPSPEQQAAMAQQERQQQLEAGRLQVDMEKLAVEREKIHAEMAKIQAEADRLVAEAQTAAVQPGAPAADPRLDAITAAVAQLSEVVSMIMEEMSAAAPPPEPPAPPAEPEGPPMALPTDLVEPPPGGFFIDPGALGQPAPEMMGQPA